MTIVTQLELLPTQAASLKPLATGSMPIVYGPFISRKQAKDKKLKHYFMGDSCSYGHISIRYTSGQCVACRQQQPSIVPNSYGPFLSRKLAMQRGIKRYYTGPCKIGHTTGRLVSSGNCIDCGTEKNRNWQQNNKEYMRKNKADRRRKNKKYINQREAAYVRKRRKEDYSYAILLRLRCRINRAIKGSAKSVATKQLIGCSSDQLVKHIENLFSPGMGWHNRSLWHIDHIRPCASFDLTDPDQQRQCFHYTNLQPLWAADNLSKGSKAPLQ